MNFLHHLVVAGTLGREDFAFGTLGKMPNVINGKGASARAHLVHVRDTNTSIKAAVS